MFSAGLIENDTYYTLRRKLLITSILSSSLLGVTAGNIWGTSYIWPLLAFALFFIGVLVQFYLYRCISAVSKRHIIEISNDMTKTLSTSGDVEESISPLTANEIQIHTTYTIPESTLSDFIQVLKGQPQRHFIRLQIDKSWRKLSFTMDSNYMAEQLKKIVRYWESIGLNVKNASKNDINT